MVRSSLVTILKRLPLLLRNRYSGEADRFWINKYNDLLGELERSNTGPKNTIMVPVPWQVISSNEVILPVGLTNIIGVFRSTGGEIAFEPAGKGVHLLESMPTASQVLSVNQIADHHKRFGRDMIQTFLTDPPTAIGDGILIHGPQVGYVPGEYKPSDAPKGSWIISQAALFAGGIEVSVPMEDGEYDWPIAGGGLTPDFYYTIRDFLIVEGHRAYHRITLREDLTSLGPEWDSMVEAYLRFKGEVQTDQTSKDSQDWAALWQVEHRKWLGNQSKMVSRAATQVKRPGISMTSRR